MLRSTIVHMLVLALGMSPIRAQEHQVSPEALRAFAEQLPPGAHVTVHLKTGDRVEGSVVQVTADALHLSPKTRVAVPIRVLTFDSIQSIERKGEGMGIGKKVAIISAVVGGVVVFILIAVASCGFSQPC